MELKGLVDPKKKADVLKALKEGRGKEIFGKRRPEEGPVPEAPKAAAQQVVGAKPAPPNLDGFDVKVRNDGKIAMEEKDDEEQTTQSHFGEEEHAVSFDLRVITTAIARPEFEKAIMQGDEEKVRKLVEENACRPWYAEDAKQIIDMARASGNPAIARIVEGYFAPKEPDVMVNSNPAEEAAPKKEGRLRKWFRKKFGGDEHE